MNDHTPVLLYEAVNGLNVQEGQIYIDATVGMGGHTLEIVKQGGVVYGIDRDSKSLDKVHTILKNTLNVDQKITLIHGDFGHMSELVKHFGISTVAGVLFDLGYSSWQLDQGKRGFSYLKHDELLDMRFNSESEEKTAADLVNHATREELYTIIGTYGEEERYKEIGDKIYRHRPYQRTGDLIQVLEAISWMKNDFRRFSRVFQAIRIAVNDELIQLKRGLLESEKLLQPKGRMVVISFHSLEDRIIKQFFMSSSKLRIITKKPIVSGSEEQLLNSRSRSAKLRIAEKL